MQKSRVRQVGALLVGLALVAASCGDDKKDSTDSVAPTTVAETTPVDTTPVDTTPVAGSELAGFKGTTPALPISDEFKARMDATQTS